MARRRRGIEHALVLGLVCCVSFLLGIGVSVAWLGVDRLPTAVTTAARHGPTIQLAIVVLTAPDYIERRDVIRATWLKSAGASVRCWFVLGTAGLQAAALSSLQQEHRRHGDLLLLDDLQDDYGKLAEKVLSAFSWLAENTNFRFVLKCDDDTFVRVPALLDLLASWPQQRLYGGFFDGRARPFSAGVWKETDWDLCDLYLPYALGGGYVLSADLVRHLAANRATLRRFGSEDVSVGAWLAPLDVQRRHDPRFDTEYRSRGCDNRYIVTHKQTPILMLEKQRSLQNSGQLCQKETRQRKSYEYDWSQPPSRCCQRTSDVSVP